MHLILFVGGVTEQAPKIQTSPESRQRERAIERETCHPLPCLCCHFQKVSDMSTKNVCRDLYAPGEGHSPGGIWLLSLTENEIHLRGQIV